jgi:L-lysine exporter family protein LysE/ArgO
MPVYFNGLLLGLSLIMALGPQNVFLIRQGAKRKHAVLSALICFCCDVILVCASVTGLHEALTKHPSLQTWISWLGALFLLYYGGCALKKGLSRSSQEKSIASEASNRWQIILLAFGFSLLNPHAIIDSLVIIGGGSAQFPEQQMLFLMGVVTSSFLWFVSLTATTHYFANTLARAAVWRRIELSSGLLMLFLSLKLAITQF